MEQQFYTYSYFILEQFILNLTIKVIFDTKTFVFVAFILSHHFIEQSRILKENCEKNFKFSFDFECCFRPTLDFPLKLGSYNYIYDYNFYHFYRIRVILQRMSFHLSFSKYFSYM
jgi:hypothetical protein